MTTTVIEFNGKRYPARQVTIGRNIMLVSVKSLAEVLFDDDGIPVSDYAECVDNEVFFYVDDDEISLEDAELVRVVMENL